MINEYPKCYFCDFTSNRIIIMAKADELIDYVFETLNIQILNEEQKYVNINEIVEELQIINAQASIAPKTTGTISERLCELGLKAAVPNLYKRIGDDWNWMADFSIYGHPFNLLISVKSFKAKERLLVSGSGNNLSPTIGWGLFDDYEEWSSENRVRKYLYRSFLAIYIPRDLFNKLPQNVKSVQNINGKLFIRDASSFISDLRTATVNDAIDISSI